MADRDHPAPITPATKLCAVLGAPVAHSGSPAMHNAAFAAEGIDARYFAFHVEPEAFETAVRGLQALGAIGVNVTVPHKAAALAVADVAGKRAQEAGAANVLTFAADGRILADNTDGIGFIRSLDEAGIALRGRRVLMVGAGGAARAVALACLEEDAAALWVANRTPGKAEALIAQLTAVLGDAAAGRLRALSLDPGEMTEALPQADVLINATSLGLKPGDPSPLSVEQCRLAQDAVAIDLIYAREPTVFLKAAAAAGLTTIDGSGMLVWQAALSWQNWFNRTGPVAVMRAALRNWLEREPS